MDSAEGRQLNGKPGQLEKLKSKTQSDLSDMVVVDWKMKVLEKLELEAALSKAKGDLEQEEKKVLRCQLEITAGRSINQLNK